jgi:hypothetical protein
VDGNGFDAHLFAGAQNAQGNFATVGDQNFIEHITNSFSGVL